jgi:hypothetical protein
LAVKIKIDKIYTGGTSTTHTVTKKYKTSELKNENKNY